MPSTVTVAEYLFSRLSQLGVGAIHGVPGDYNLTLLDKVEPAGLQWIGNANELNAGYATDGYARVKGIGALITTFGVGELSAINAIAGAFAERVPVVHIVGVPWRAYQDTRRLTHHTFNDGEFGHFAKMHRHVTACQTKLWDPRTIPEQIDWTLRQCLFHSRPVYIEVPVDIVGVQVLSKGLEAKLEIPENQFPAEKSVVKNLSDKINAAKQPVILVDGEVKAFRLVEEVGAFVESSGWPTWTSAFGKSLIDESLPNFHGIYRGDYDSQEAQNFIKGADLLFCFGPHFSSTNSFLFSSVPDLASKHTVLFNGSEVKFGDEVIRDVPIKGLLRQLTDQVKSSGAKVYKNYPRLPKDSILPFSAVPKDEKIAQRSLWRILGNFLRPGDIILGETGTAGYGVRDIHLPYKATLFNPVTWLSIGYMLPASQGAALAQRQLMESSQYHGITNARTILVIGDGSFQMTAQELSTIIRYNLNVVVFLLNNDGYTIERCIHGENQVYNDVAPWRYLDAPRFFGAPENSFVESVKTWGQLEKVLTNERLADGAGLRMVEVFLEKDDAPDGPLIEYLEKQRAREKVVKARL